MNRNSSTWTSAEIDAIESALSSERLSRYLSATSAKSDALKTYAWNTAISAAFYGPLQCLEVALRNAVHGCLESEYGTDWYQNGQLLTSKDLEPRKGGHSCPFPRAVHLDGEPCTGIRCDRCAPLQHARF